MLLIPGEGGGNKCVIYLISWPSKFPPLFFKLITRKGRASREFSLGLIHDYTGQKRGQNVVRKSLLILSSSLPPSPPPSSPAGPQESGWMVCNRVHGIPAINQMLERNEKNADRRCSWPPPDRVTFRGSLVLAVFRGSIHQCPGLVRGFRSPMET